MEVLHMHTQTLGADIPVFNTEEYVLILCMIPYQDYYNLTVLKITIFTQ